jgi:biopolymer transport protein ExbD
MHRFPSYEKKPSRIEIIPMIDVMMFLLVFFVLISLNVIPMTGVKTKLPTAGVTEQANPKNKVVITLLKNGEMMFDDIKVQVSNLSSLLEKKKSEFGENFSVLINGDESASLQNLIDVMDVLKKNNISAMTIAAKKRF